METVTGSCCKKTSASCACSASKIHPKKMDLVIGLAIGLMIGIELDRYPAYALAGFAISTLVFAYGATYIRRLRGDDVFRRIFEGHTAAVNAHFCGLNIKKMMGGLLILIAFLLTSLISVGIWTSYRDAKAQSQSSGAPA